jgi:PadR family transcriptional regulator, regulatory protein PadR
MSDDFTELLRGTVPTLILASLADSPRHGYAIAREIERCSDDALALGDGSLYPALRALERAGFVQGEWQAQSGGPARKVYSITDSGSAELARRTRTWQRFVATVQTIIAGGKTHAEPV